MAALSLLAIYLTLFGKKEDLAMNLAEAYELRRREVIALTIENKKLKNGAYFDEERASYEKEIRRLQTELQASEKKRSNCISAYHRLEKESLRTAEVLYQDYEKKLYSIESEYLDKKTALQEKVDKLEALVLELKTANAEKDRKIAELEASNGKLNAQINKDYENSSIPSSQKPFHKKISNNREITGRKPGAQPGHEGHRRKILEPTEEPILITTPEDISSNPDLYPTDKYVEKQVVDIELNVIVKTYRAQIFRSHSTGKRVHANFPEGVYNEVNYGSSVKALAFLLNNYCNVSIAKTRAMINELSDGVIDLSNGLVGKLVEEFSLKTEVERKEIFDKLTKAEVLYTDATGARVNSKGKAVMVCTTPHEALYFFKDHKGHEGVKGTPVEFFLNTLVHDHDKTFYNYGGNHQECLAHILRYLKNSIEIEPELTWNKDMHKLLQNIIHIFKENYGQLEEEKIENLKKQYMEIIAQGYLEYEIHPPAKWYPDGQNLLKRLDKYSQSTLFFLNNPDVDYTNNLSERACRKFKRHQQSMVTFRSQKHGEYFCNALGILETARLNGKNLFTTVKNGFEKASP